MPLAVIVEDEWSIRMQIADLFLDAGGWQVKEFSSGEQALTFLKGSPEVELLVTDIRLSGTATGWDVAQAYRKANPAVKVVYCTGNIQETARQVPDSKFLSKPCRMDQIMKAATA